MRFSKLGKVTSTVSLVTLLAAAGISSAQAVSPALNANIDVSSSVKTTPHVFEKTITKQPLGPQDSGLCGEAGLVPIMPEDTIEYHYELRNNVVDAVANPGFVFDPELKLQTKWMLNPAYFSCPDPDMFIVNPIEVPTFIDKCGVDNDKIILPANTRKYYYVIVGAGVVAHENPGFIFQQDIVTEFAGNTAVPCEPLAAPVVTAPIEEVAPEPALVAPVVAEVPAEVAQPEEPSAPTDAAIQLQTETVQTKDEAGGMPLADVGLSGYASRANLAKTGPVFDLGTASLVGGGFLLTGLLAFAALLKTGRLRRSAVKK
jgi:hypothetical protein